MKKPFSPCKDCEARSVGCHSICEQYIEYQQAVKTYNELMKQERVRNYFYTGNSIKKVSYN